MLPVVSNNEGLLELGRCNAGFPVFYNSADHFYLARFRRTSMQMFQHFLLWWFKSDLIQMLSCKKKKKKGEKTVTDLCGQCSEFTCSTCSVQRGPLLAVLDPAIGSFYPGRKTPVRYLRNFGHNIQNILLSVKLNQDTWWPSGMNFCTMYKVKQETQTRKYFKHTLVILIIYDCRPC